jgi:hypothetical protein
VIRLPAFIAILAIAAAVVAISPAAHAGTLPDITGTWYAQGDHSKRCHIEQTGTSVTLRNEIGQRASGTFTDPSTLSTEWPMSTISDMGPKQRITGHISNDLTEIRWSNNTFWTRPGSSVPGGGGLYPVLSGTWLMGGDPSKVCHIAQTGDTLTLTNEIGQRATGTFSDATTIHTRWPSSTFTDMGPKLHITGHISRDGRTINWSNNTTWTRAH